jgi:outer membrane lipoprotein carrier protein
MKITKFAVAVLSLVFAAQVSKAQTSLTLDQVVSGLDDNFQKISAYQASFTQEITSEQFGKTISKGAGELSYSKPGKMAWRYTSPEQHLYITDGKTLWDYAPASKQAMKMKLDEALSSNLPKSFLFGMGKLKDQFDLSFAADQAKDKVSVYHLLLTPKKEEDRAALGVIELFVDAKTMLVQEAITKDLMGNQNILRFSNIKVNPRIDPKIFVFTPGKDVEVLNPSEESPAPPEKLNTPAKSGTQNKVQKGAEEK